MRAAGAIQVGLGELRTPNPYSMDWFRGKFTGKKPYLMVKTMVSCNFSLKPIQ
jgi:hypothetical protein